MHRIDTSTVQADKFGAGKDGFTEGDAPTGVASTQISDDWLDAVQEELVAPIEHVGLALKTSTTDTRNQLLLTMRQMHGLTGLVNLTEQSNPVTNLNAVCYAAWARLWVAVGAPTIDAAIVTSPDGITWTERANPKAFALCGITHNGSNLFVAVGYADGVDAYIVTSPDGITWTERANPKNFSLLNVVWASSLNLFVAVGLSDGGDAYIVTSPDGIAWTERANPKAFALSGIAWSGSILVAVGYADGSDAYIVTSPNGITWTERANPSNYALYSVAWASWLGKFVAGGADAGTQAYMVQSSDGITWTAITNPLNDIVFGVASDGIGLLVAVCANDGAGYSTVMYSLNGTDWRFAGLYQGVDLYGAAYCSEFGYWALVGPVDGVDARIYTSLKVGVTG